MNFLNKSVESYVDVARIDDIILKTLRTFRNLFPPCYKNALLESVMNRGKVSIDCSYLLNSAPKPSAPLKVGILMKRGDHMKTWKKRQFIAYNEADNFEIAYGKSDSPGDEIARFSCSGYTVECFTADETLVYGEHGIKLTPMNSTKRRWMFCALSAQEHAEWLLVFAHACRKASAERDPDALVREAFAVAYQQTRQLYGFYGCTNLRAGTEMELLHVLVVEVLQRELIDDLVAAVEQGLVGELLQHAPVSSSADSGRTQSRTYSSSSSAQGMSAFNPMRLLSRSRSASSSSGAGAAHSQSASVRQQQVSAIRRLVEEKVQPAVALCWENCREEVIGFSSDFIARVMPLASEILACEEAIEEALYAPVVEHIDPVHTELQFRLLTPLAAICGPSIVDAYEMALRSLFREVSGRIGGIMCSPETLDTEIEQLLAQVERNAVLGDTEPDNINANSLLIASKEILLNMARVGLSELAEDFVGAITPDEIYFRVMDDLRLLVNDAVFSFGFALRSQGVTNRIVSIFNETILKLCTDMSARMRASFFQILQEVAESSVQDSMILPCKDLFKEVRKNAFVPPPLKEMIFTHFVGDRFIKELVCMTLTNIVDHMFADCVPRLHGVVTQLCDTLPITA